MFIGISFSKRNMCGMEEKSRECPTLNFELAKW